MTSSPKYGSLEWRAFQYKAALEAKRGHNYSYFSEKLQEELLAKGYQWHEFNSPRTEMAHKKFCTTSEYIAKDAVDQYRATGHYARIICGMEQNVQRVKYFSVIFKKKP